LPAREGDITYFDASFYWVKVTAPADLVLVASGVEVVRESVEDGQVVTLAAGPARGFYIAASADYTVVSQMMGETRVNSFSRRGQEEAAELALGFAVGALRSYNERFGPYPYTEFDVVGIPMMALGMEYPGMTAITLEVYDLGAMVRGVPAPGMMEGVVGHEVAHQWFYNVVGNDQVDEPWLDEAVVQYVTGLYYLDTYGEPGYQGWRGSWIDRWARVDQAEIPIGLPVGEYSDGAYGAIVYGRGPLFVEALAEEMGQAAFDAFLRDYYQSHAWDIGTGQAFRRLAEEHCQCDLTELFTTWVHPEEYISAPGASGSTSSGRGIEGWAVLAEKDDYSDVDMTDLPVDHIEIKVLRQVLEDAGWDPAQIHDVKEFDREALEDELDWLEANAREDDFVLVFVGAHGRYVRNVLAWGAFFDDEWAQIPSRRRVLVMDTCQAADFTRAVSGDPAPYLTVAAVDADEYGWCGLEEEGLPIIGGVFTHYFAAAFRDESADSDGDGCVSVQEAALLAENQQRRYMHDVVFAVPQFLEMYHTGGGSPEEDPTFPDVIIDDAIGEPVCLRLEHYH
ncbi:MAG: M1 family metallopeptidase, partial [Anaerolineae bacterium]